MPNYNNYRKKDWPEKASDWVGRRVATTVPITTGSGKIPVGTVCLVTHSFGGMTLETEECRQCGTSLKVHSVAWSEVRLLDETDSSSEIRSFAVKVTGLKKEANRIGLYKTAQALERVVRKVGWEIAEQIEKERIS